MTHRSNKSRRKCASCMFVGCRSTLLPNCTGDFDFRTSPLPEFAILLGQKIFNRADPTAQPSEEVPNVPRVPQPIPIEKRVRTLSRSGKENVSADSPIIYCDVEIPPAPQLPEEGIDMNDISSPLPLDVCRWKSIQSIYDTMTAEQKKLLKPFHGLASFLRLHGRVFEVSEDKTHVVEHRVGKVPPLLHLEDALGAINRRSELLQLDPTNPYLNQNFVAQAIHDFLPDHPVPVKVVLQRLPRLLCVALPSRKLSFFARSKLFSIWKSEPGVFVVQKSALGPPPDGYGLLDTCSIEEAVNHLRSIIPPQGLKLTEVRSLLIPAARNTIRRFGGTRKLIDAYPQFFSVDSSVIWEPIVRLTENMELVQPKAVHVDRTEEDAQEDSEADDWDEDSSSSSAPPAAEEGAQEPSE